MDQTRESIRRVGIIINPVAGMGGKVGLKGTDGEDAYLRAVSLGAQPEAGLKARKAVEQVVKSRTIFDIVACNGVMGEDALNRAGIGMAEIIEVCEGERSHPDNTLDAVRQMLERSIDIIMFAGGDGTARLISKGIEDWYGKDAVEAAPPCIGIPAGVKIQSSVFAHTPREAGDILLEFIEAKSLDYLLGEVVDLDEDLYRQGIVAPKFHGVLRVPSVAHKLQSKKSRSGNEERAEQMMIAHEVVSTMEPDTLYLFGPGSTTRCICDKMKVGSTLIGVDAVLNGQILGYDLTEQDILELIGRYNTKAVITPIGGQGFIFGRGSHQFSDRVIRRIGFGNFIVAATKNKINSLPGRQLYVDTGSDELDKSIRGYVRVITGIKEALVVRVS